MFFTVLAIVIAIIALFMFISGLGFLLIKDNDAYDIFYRLSSLSETERAEYREKCNNYNMKNLRLFNGRVSILYAANMALLSASTIFDFGLFGNTLVFFLFIPLTIGIFVYFRKSKKLRNNHES